MGLTSTKPLGQVPCLSTQHRAPGENQTYDLVIKSLTLSHINDCCNQTVYF